MKRAKDIKRTQKVARTATVWVSDFYIWNIYSTSAENPSHCVVVLIAHYCMSLCTLTLAQWQTHTNTNCYSVCHGMCVKRSRKKKKSRDVGGRIN